MRRLLLVLPLVLGVPACSDDGAGQTPAPDQREEFVAAAERICSDANDEVAAVATPTTVDTVAPYAEQVVGVLDRTVAELSALELPEDDAELTEKVLDPLRADALTARDYAAQVRAAADAGDSAALLDLVAALPNTTADLAFMRSYGLTQCAAAADTTS